MDKPQHLPECLTQLSLDRDSPLSLIRQLYLSLYEAISRGTLPEGTVLPASRTLAAKLGVARNTVTAAYTQLSNERLVSSEGSRSTRVIYNHQPILDKDSKSAQQADTSKLSQRCPHGVLHERFHTLCPGEPDSSLFPANEWQRAMAKSAKLPSTTLGYRTQGQSRLQHSIARHLAVYRSLMVDPSRIILTSSTRQSLLLAATLYADAGDSALVESPGYSGAIDAFSAQGLKLIRSPVDASGATIPEQTTRPKLVYLTPCFHFPTGVPLSTQRRSEFLTLSRDQGTVLFEDDYDSEFRDQAQPRPALASQADEYGACVLHAGTFSKLLFPAARVAWLVVPSEHSEVAWRCLQSLGGGHGAISQTVISELLDSGAISKHLQRARQIYTQRRTVLNRCVNRSKVMDQVTGGGLTAVVTLHKARPIAKLRQELLREKLGVEPLEHYLWDLSSNKHSTKTKTKTKTKTTKHLVLGMGNVDSLALPKTIKSLERAITQS